MSRGVGFDLRAIQRQLPELHQSCFATELDHFDKERLKALEVDLAKVADGPEVGNVTRDDDPKGRVVFATLHDLARRQDSRAVGVEQEREHHPRIKRRLALRRLLVVSENRTDIEVANDIQNQIDEILHLVYKTLYLLTLS